MASCVWSEAPSSGRDVWKSSPADHGAPSLTVIGLEQMLKLFAEHWATLGQVCSYIANDASGTYVASIYVGAKDKVRS